MTEAEYLDEIARLTQERDEAGREARYAMTMQERAEAHVAALSEAARDLLGCTRQGSTSAGYAAAARRLRVLLSPEVERLKRGNQERENQERETANAVVVESAPTEPQSDKRWRTK